MCQNTVVKFFDFFCNAPRIADGNRQLKILFLTSVRDTGEFDRNGEMIATPEGPRYMEGVIERTIKESCPGDKLYPFIQVAGVVTDDLAKDLKEYPVWPTESRSWIYPNLDMPEGGKLWDATFHIPSAFRLLPLGNIEARKNEKLEFEMRVLWLMQKLGANVVISDHYMARIAYLLPPALQFGCVLNIHPAITLAGHPCCFRGATPTADAIATSQTRLVKTGATLHLVDQIIDHGPIIAFSEDTPVLSTDEPQSLRYRNYQAGKLPVFVAGLTHYARCIYPNLPSIDFSRQLQYAG